VHSVEEADGVLVVGTRAGCPLDGLCRLEGHRDGFAAFPERAPFVGIPPEHAPGGVSFAVARVSAWVCRARQLLPDGHAMDVRDALDAVCDR
jgi:hypothetical protein